MGGWMDGWIGWCKPGLRDCYVQSKSRKQRIEKVAENGNKKEIESNEKTVSVIKW